MVGINCIRRLLRNQPAEQSQKPFLAFFQPDECLLARCPSDPYLISYDMEFFYLAPSVLSADIIHSIEAFP